MPVIKYESVQEFARSLPKFPHYQGDMHWAGGLDYKECIRAIEIGDDESLRESDKLLERVEGDGIELLSPMWENNRTGAFPCVPSFLAGDPEAMRHLTLASTDVAPIRIYIDLFLSCGFSAEQCRIRGVTLLALARKLQAIRPVEMYLIMSCGDRDSKKRFKDGWISPMIKLETSPLDLTTASFVLGHPGFVRQLTFNWCIEQGADSCIPYYTEAKERLDLEEQDLFINNAIFQRDALRDPVAWVNAQVKKYAGDMAADAS